MKNETKKKLTNGFENVMYWIAITGSVLSLIGILSIPICHFTIHLHNCANFLASLGVISTGCSAIWFFISERKDNRLKYSVKLVEEFDCEDLRKARDLTRKIKELWETQIIDGEKLANYINTGVIQIQEIQPVEKYLSNEAEPEKLKASLIYLFNYWQRVYAGIKYNLADDEYILAHLGKTFVSQYTRFETWFKNYNNDFQQKKDLIAFKKKAQQYLNKMGEI